MENILIASLGESPVVITAMYEALTNLLNEQKEPLIHPPISKIIVLHSQEGLMPAAIDLLQDALKDRCEVIPESLPFEDADSEEEAYNFLHILYTLLNTIQESGDAAYLSLAGGRKSMSALMAILVPLFPCVKGLYHIIDKDEDSRKQHFLSIEKLFESSPDERFTFLFPPRDRMRLVNIPYSEQQQVSKSFRSQLYTISDEKLWETNTAEAEALEFAQDIAKGAGQTIEVLLTEDAANQFEELWQHDRTHADALKLCLEHMRFTGILRNRSHDIYTYKLQKGEQDIYSQNLPSLTLHFFKRGGATERPVFYTVPKDVKNCSDKEVERVIVTELEFKRNGKYRALKDITAKHPFPLGPFVPLPTLLASEIVAEHNNILIVPLGTTPMIATQLYTLLSAQQQTVHEVVLIYPQGSLAVRNSVQMAKDAFAEEGVQCRAVSIQGYKDIDSREACQAYLKTLEETIDDIRKEDRSATVELALSGGRKGMAALTMFAAQNKGIRYVYHTLITDKKLHKQVERETDINALRGTMLSKEERNNRLFLRTYEGKGSYTHFVLFKVPVLPTGV